MSKSLFLVNVEPPEMRIAEVRDGRLFDFTLERDGRLLGDIFKARVENILPGMDAAFVNLGLERNALIYAGDVGPGDGPGDRPTAGIASLLKVGDEILVQIARPPVGTKGARVTNRLSVPGRYAVLVTNTDTIGVSRRIDSDEERSRLRRIAEKNRPLDHGIIVRTEAEGITEGELTRDIRELHGLMQSIHAEARQSPAPVLLHHDLGALGRLARDRLNDDTDAVVIDNQDIYEAFQSVLARILPAYVGKARLHNATQSIFEYYRIQDDIDAASERSVPLPSGGYLTIDEAEALTAIDVNTGKYVGKSRLADTVLKTNLEAVDEVARQIRLRDIGGVIVIDFIDMERTRDRIQVMNALDAALKLDPTRTRIVQLSPLGLVEMTRRREGYSLRELLHRPCPYCSGEGIIKTPTTIAIDARRRVRELANRLQGERRQIQVTLHPENALSFMGNECELVQQLEDSTGAEVMMRVDFNLHLESNRVEPMPVDARLPHDMAVGGRLLLPAHAPLYPESAPQFAVLHGMLINLSNLDRERKGGGQPHPATLEVTAVGRWFITARVMTYGEPAAAPPALPAQPHELPHAR